MKFSILPPTSGTRTSTVVLNSSREPPPDFAGASTVVPLSVAGAPVIEPLRETPFDRFFFRDPNGYLFEVLEEERGREDLVG